MYTNTYMQTKQERQNLLHDNYFHKKIEFIKSVKTLQEPNA